MHGQMFAVKRINLKNLRSHGLQVADVQNEIDTLKRLAHINVIRYVADYSTPKDKPKEMCIVMELASGGSLAALIPSKPAPQQIARIMKDMAGALQYIHSSHVLHRDIKADNVLLSSRGIIKLADFGLACAYGETSASVARTRVGSDRYYSPEKANGNAYDGRDDVWAAGCIFIELCTGERMARPIWSDTAEASARREALISAAAQVMPGLEHVARGMLALKKHERMEASDVFAEVHAHSKKVRLCAHILHMFVSSTKYSKTDATFMSVYPMMSPNEAAQLI